MRPADVVCLRLSFKDFGAQFLAQAMTAIAQTKQQLILVATSGLMLRSWLTWETRFFKITHS